MCHRGVLLEGDRGGDLYAKLVTLSRELGNVLDNEQREAQLTVEWNGSAAREIGMQRGTADDDRFRQCIDVERSARQDSLQQHDGACPPADAARAVGVRGDRHSTRRSPV